MSSPGYIAIEQDGVVQVHAVGVISNYATLCGMDGNDSSVGQKPAPLVIGARINCAHCRDIINHAKQYRPSDFEGHRRNRKNKPRDDGTWIEPGHEPGA